MWGTGIGGGEGRGGEGERGGGEGGVFGCGGGTQLDTLFGTYACCSTDCSSTLWKLGSCPNYVSVSGDTFLHFYK